MFGLPQEIAGHERRIGLVVRDHHNLRRPRQQVDPATPVKLPLRFRHELVSRPAQHVDRLKDAHAESHHGKRRNPAQNEDTVRPGLLHGVHRGGEITLPLHGRREGIDVPDPRHLGGNDAHLRRAEHGIAPARNVASHRFHGHVLVAQNNAREGFHAQRQERRHLRLCKGSHIGLAKIRILHYLGLNPGDRLRHLRRAQFKVRRVPIVEFPAVAAHGFHAVALQVEQHLRRQSPRIQDRFEKDDVRLL